MALLLLHCMIPSEVSAKEHEESFSIVVLPDTQYYSQDKPHLFDSQVQWIIENREELNIAFVTHEGDLVQSYGNEGEWENASNAMDALDGEVPYGVLPGNHDFQQSDDYTVYVRQAIRVVDVIVPLVVLPRVYDDEATNLYNTYFPHTRYEGKPWYGGHYGNNNMNSYQLFSAGGEDYIILHIQYNPSDQVLEWADSVLLENSNRKAIVTTHSLLDPDGERNAIGDRIFEVLKDNENLFLMLCGHMHAESMRYDVVDGRKIYQLLADYQKRSDGGEGWLRLMRFVPSEGKVYVRTYSPHLGQYETDQDSEFVLDYASGESESTYKDSTSKKDHAPLLWIPAVAGISSGFGFIVIARKRKPKLPCLH
ncbi:MAG: metallophosphoesterase [Chloroflexota bacterium]|nr:metallophosphoesterase [Chloroflexota bacterium]